MCDGGWDTNIDGKTLTGQKVLLFTSFRYTLNYKPQSATIVKVNISQPKLCQAGTAYVLEKSIFIQRIILLKLLKQVLKKKNVICDDIRSSSGNMDTNWIAIALHKVITIQLHYKNEKQGKKFVLNSRNCFSVSGRVSCF